MFICVLQSNATPSVTFDSFVGIVRSDLHTSFVKKIEQSIIWWSEELKPLHFLYLIPPLLIDVIIGEDRSVALYIPTFVFDVIVWCSVILIQLVSMMWLVLFLFHGLRSTICCRICSCLVARDSSRIVTTSLYRSLWFRFAVARLCLEKSCLLLGHVFVWFMYDLITLYMG